MIKKNDPILGEKVRQHLLSQGLETPMIKTKNKIESKETVNTITSHFEKIMEALGLDLTNDSLADTPLRVAKMFGREIFVGMDYDNFPKCTAVKNATQYDSMVIEQDINVSSQCEHHFVPIDGRCHIAYIPNGKVIGLSKLNRVVDFFSRRPQIQERLTQQIGSALEFILETKDVAVVIKAAHFCVKSRGIKDRNSLTTTSTLSGRFRDDASCRAEFMSLIK